MPSCLSGHCPPQLWGGGGGGRRPFPKECNLGHTHLLEGNLATCILKLKLSPPLVSAVWLLGLFSGNPGPEPRGGCSAIHRLLDTGL